MHKTIMESTLSFQDIFERTFRSYEARFCGATVVDVPAGSGNTARWLSRCGATVIALDLFPDFFKAEGLQCNYCDLADRIPLPDETADFLVSQEGLEHIPNQINAFKEFSRVLKINGRLLLTCPNGSNLTAKVSHLLGESERYGRIMPPNSVDGIWCNSATEEKLYYGHLFIPTATKTRLFGQLAGLELVQVHFSEFKLSCFLWFLFLYPFILLSQLKNYLRNSRRNPAARTEYQKAFMLSINPKILLDGSMVLEFEKIMSSEHAQEVLRTNWGAIQKNKP